MSLVIIAIEQRCAIARHKCSRKVVLPEPPPGRQNQRATGRVPLRAVLLPSMVSRAPHRPRCSKHQVRGGPRAALRQDHFGRPRLRHIYQPLPPGPHCQRHRRRSIRRVLKSGGNFSTCRSFARNFGHMCCGLFPAAPNCENAEGLCGHCA